MVLHRLRMDELASSWTGGRNTPAQIGLLGRFDSGGFQLQDGAVDLERIRVGLATRATRVAALTRSILWTGPGEGRPVWVVAPGFDATEQVHCVTLPPGADLAAWVADRAARPLDLHRPLWRAEVIGGLRDGGWAVLLVVSHVLADGLTGMAIVGSLLDQGSEAGSTEQPPVLATTPVPSRRELVGDHVRELAASLRRSSRADRRSRARRRGSRQQLRRTMAGFAGREPATSLPRHVGAGRRLGIVRQDLPQLHDTGHALGVTVNDLILAAVAGGLRSLLAGRSELVAGLVLRCIVPAGTGVPGSQVMGMLVVGLPVGEADPARRLARIHEGTAAGKARMRTAGGDPTDLHLPVFIARPMLRIGRRFGSHRISLSVADVPGPAEPLWLGGARLLEMVPIAPLMPLVPLAVAALSYAGELAVSVNADAAVTDLETLAAGMARSFAELHDLARSPASGGRTEAA